MAEMTPTRFKIQRECREVCLAGGRVTAAAASTGAAPAALLECLSPFGLALGELPERFC